MLCRTGYHLSPKHLNTENIEGLASDIFRSHVNDTFHAKLGTDSGSGDTVLSGTGFSDDSCLPYATGEQNLTLGKYFVFVQLRRCTWPMALLILCEPVWFLWP